MRRSLAPRLAVPAGPERTPSGLQINGSPTPCGILPEPCQTLRREVDRPHFDALTIQPGRWSRRSAGKERWVKPAVVAEVSFTEWTSEGRVRHAVFQGLRLDTAAKLVTREVAQAPIGTEAAQLTTSIKVTNPERVIDPRPD